MRTERVEIGVVSRAHGIKGEVVALPHDPQSTSLAEVEHLWIGGVRRAVLRARPVPPGAYLLALEGIADLTLDDDDVLLADLVGCKCVLPDGTPWGEIVAVEPGAMQDRLVIHHDGIERQLPVVDAFIASIDVAAGTVTVTPPEGLPEDPIA